MKMNKLGKSELHISALSLGCMSLGTNVKVASRIIDAGLDAGINHLDTADLYDFGENERIIGEAIKQKRDKLIITSKVGNHFDANARTHYWDPSKEHLEASIKDTLRRLGTDYLDIYMLHGGTIDDPIDETIEAFEKLKQAGLIRAYGISSIRPNVIKEYVKRSNIDVVMMQYSLLDRRPEELLGLLHENEISVVARGTLAKGILTEKAAKYMEQKALDGYLDYRKIELRQTIQHLQTLGEPLQKLSMQYVLKNPAVASAVIGASSVAQLCKATQYKNASEIEEALYLQCKNLTKQSLYTAHR